MGTVFQFLGLRLGWIAVSCCSISCCINEMFGHTWLNGLASYENQRPFFKKNKLEKKLERV